MFLSHNFLFDFYQIGLIAAQPGSPARFAYCTTMKFAVNAPLIEYPALFQIVRVCIRSRF
jgi:hypothetical protein